MDAMGDLRRGGKQIRSSRFLIHRLGCPFAAGLALSNTPSVYPPISPTRPRMGRSSAVEYCEGAPDSKLPHGYSRCTFSLLLRCTRLTLTVVCRKGRRADGLREKKKATLTLESVVQSISISPPSLINSSSSVTSPRANLWRRRGGGSHVINSTTSSGGGGASGTD